MKLRRTLAVFCFVLILVSGAVVRSSPAQAGSESRQSGQATPGYAFTGTTAVVKSEDQDEVNLRGGPGTDYSLVGKLLAGDSAPALGRSEGGDWVLISYPSAPGGVAWIYAYLVTLDGTLPVVAPPPTPTPRITPTVDQTLAAQFLREVPPTRLPTFTSPPPLAIPTFEPAAAAPLQGNVVMAYLIIGLGIFGVLGILVSFLRVH